MKCKIKQSSPMSNSAWCHSNSLGDILKLHDFCHNPRYKCGKQITFTPRQSQLGRAGFKTEIQKFFRGTQTACNKLLKLAVSVAAPFKGLAVGAETRSPQAARDATNLLKPISRV